jgi:hypothetical protein
MKTKKCTTCKLEQPLSQYRKDASRFNGIHPTCNNCNKEIQKRWYANNKEKAKEAASKRYHQNKHIINAKRKEKRINNPEEVRAKSRSYYNPITSKVSSWRNAGIKNMTYDRYLQMLESQNNCCAICGLHKDTFQKQLAVDHDHKTGEPRGLLCLNCNNGLGKLKDSVELLEKAINYLKQTI